MDEERAKIWDDITQQVEALSSILKILDPLSEESKKLIIKALNKRVLRREDESEGET